MKEKTRRRGDTVTRGTLFEASPCLRVSVSSRPRVCPSFILHPSSLILHPSSFIY